MLKIKKTIFRILFINNLILITLVMLVIALLFSWRFSNYVFQEKQSVLHSAAEQTSLLLDRYQNNAISYSELNNSLTILSNMTGSVIYCTKLDKESLNNHVLRIDQQNIDSYLVDDLRTILDGQEVTRKKQFSNQFHTDVIFVGIPMKNRNQIEGAILVFAPVNEISAYIARINLTIWLAALVGVILSGIAIYFIALRITKPLRIMEVGARKIASGEQVNDLAINSGDELQTLALSFNSMKNKIAAAEKMRREFIASVSHDLRTPLTSINGFVLSILDGIVTGEEIPKFLKIVKEETQRLIALTEDILEMAKLQASGLVISRKYFNVKELLTMVLENTGILYNAKKIRIEVDCPDAIEVYADAERLKQVLINLLDNALKFTAQNGKISIMVSECKEEVVIRIKDNGQGIPPEELPLIFDQFYRGDISRHESTGGAGLGLNIVKMIVEAHGGRIEAFSVPEQGTEMMIHLPN